jgi:hypothetical protein
MADLAFDLAHSMKLSLSHQQLVRAVADLLWSGTPLPLRLDLHQKLLPGSCCLLSGLIHLFL